MQTRIGRVLEVPGLAAPRNQASLLLFVMGLAVMLIVTGCSYSQKEPGLFAQRQSRSPSPKPTQAELRRPPERTNPRLPVAGEAVWTSGEGLLVTTRYAVHAIRRIPGATVLDWSVTPLQAPGLAFGDDIPAWLDLGLSRESEGDINIFLLDASSGKVYRPLTHESRRQFNRCLCSPLWVAQIRLRIGETRLLQVTYPELPASVDFLDVDMKNLPPFFHLPVTPLGQVPVAVRSTDLARPPDGAPPLAPARRFRYPEHQAARVQSITVDKIVASPNRTSMLWTIHSLTDQPSFSLVPYGPPVSAPLPAESEIVIPGAASGPKVRPTGVAGAAALSTRWMTENFQGRGYFECLCTDLGLWASSLEEAGARVTVTTNYPPLPSGTSKVDVILPTLGTLHGLPVVRATDGASLDGPPVNVPVGQWTYSVDDPPRGWRTGDWPTPVPSLSQLPALSLNRGRPGQPSALIQAFART